MRKPVSIGQTHNLISVLANNTDWGSLDGDAVQQIINDPKGSGTEFTDFLRNGGRVARTERIFPVWMTLTSGGIASKQLLKLLQDHNFFVSDGVKDLMGKPVFSTSAGEYRVSLARVKIQDFGFNSAPTTTELFARAKEHGLGLCPAEVGAHLRLALRDQPLGDWFWVATEPIVGSRGCPNVFDVERSEDGKRWLDAVYVYPVDRWRLDNEIVFLQSE